MLKGGGHHRLSRPSTYSITSSARNRIDAGIVRPSSPAVLRLFRTRAPIPDGRGAATSTHMRRPHKLAQDQPKSCQGDIPVRSVASSPTPKRCPMMGEGGTVTSPDRIGLGGRTWLGTTGLGGTWERASKMPRGISGLGMAASPLRQRPHLDRTLWPQQIGRQASPNSGREASERGRLIRSPRRRGPTDRPARRGRAFSQS
jgi:hypothetical protein